MGTLSTVWQDDPRAVGLVTVLRLGWFIRLRWVFFVSAVAVLTLERFVRPHAERPLELAGLLIGLGVVNLLWTLISYVLFRDVRRQPLSNSLPLRRLVIFANAQVAVDLLLLTGILRYTGGAENPLSIFYLFHMAIVSLVLRRWQAILQGVWAVVLYATLVIGEWRQWFTPHFDFLVGLSLGNYAQAEYVFAVLTVVACGVFGVLHFTLHIAGRLDARERQLQQANAALRRSQAAIQQLQQRRSRFMQTAAHQLKTPLAVIQTLIQLIPSKTAPPDAVPGICEKIIRRCQDGITQVRELLTLARVQKPDPGRHRRCRTDVRQAICELCNRFKPLAESKQITLVCRMPRHGPLTAWVDPQDLRDCIGNLIENAIKYTPGPGRVRVTVTPRLPSGEAEVLLINVSDTGMGIDPALLHPADGESGRAAVFESFRRGSNVTTAGIPGTGLGLSIARQVVEQAGGHIRVTSRPGRGASFAVTLPAGGPDAV